MKIITLILSIISFSFQCFAAEGPQRAEGTAPGDLKWKVFFNLPDCDHSSMGQRAGAFCENEDKYRSADSNGVEAQLKSWISDPKVKSLYLSYFSFSNTNIAGALCKETSKRDLKVNVFLDKGPSQIGTFKANVEKLDEAISNPENAGSGDSVWDYDSSYKAGCSQRLNIVPRGSGSFGNGNYLQHSKIFMALEKDAIPTNISSMKTWLKDAGRVRFTSSSANMSSYGTTLHFENWMFFDAPARDFVAQQNICTFFAFVNSREEMSVQRDDFKRIYRDCERNVLTNTSRRHDLKFYIVPNSEGNKRYRPLGALTGVIESAREKVKVAIHRLTTTSVIYPLSNAVWNGVPVQMIQDDDTLKVSVEGGGGGLDVGGYDVKIFRKILDARVDISFMETNSDTTTHMFHNKFVVADDAQVFQGAGNFTASALNTFGDGNYEQFYVVKIPELAQAYGKAWNRLRELSTLMKDHPVGNNKLKCTRSEGNSVQVTSCDDPDRDQQ